MTHLDNRQLSARLLRQLLRSQRDEEEGHLVYAALARREKNPKNREILARMASEEKDHARVWKRYTGKDSSPNMLRVAWLKFVGLLLGFTFVLKRLQQDESATIKVYKAFEAELPEAGRIVEEEKAHEAALIDMLDEERLQYVGAMVLGLNDALVELTGTIAGLSFALMNTQLVALSGIITGVSATLSMAASNYLAERADGNPNALRSSLYTGVAYLITVVLLVLPYLLMPAHLYVPALVIMLVTVIAIIFFFNYYISVAKSLPFWKRFGEMAVISLTVAAISFVIGIIVKQALGIDL